MNQSNLGRFACCLQARLSMIWARLDGALSFFIGWRECDSSASLDELLCSEDGLSEDFASLRSKWLCVFTHRSWCCMNLLFLQLLNERSLSGIRWYVSEYCCDLLNWVLVCSVPYVVFCVFECVISESLVFLADCNEFQLIVVRALLSEHPSRWSESCSHLCCHVGVRVELRVQRRWCNPFEIHELTVIWIFDSAWMFRGDCQLCSELLHIGRRAVCKPCVSVLPLAIAL